ncbi:hypothetical protein ACH5RR_027099 [Cinchona calisaya]|uniref:CUE domain-containing protein n=1 Tax=Cinchona calisaya TaxID=153742 RepID=A0ABD2Z8E4_9GENT
MSKRFSSSQNNNIINNNRNENNKKGFHKTQKQFNPKREQTPSNNQTLSNSLRQSFSNQSDHATSTEGGDATAVAGSSCRVKIGENGKWVSSNSSNGIQSGNFVNYLPQDEAVASGLGPDEGGLDSVESQRVVDLLNRQLSRLLKLKPREFWKEVASDTSLHAFLESFLKYKSRWYDFPYRGAKGIVAGVIVGEFELCRRVFMVLYRISSNRDPGAKTADSLSSNDHSSLLQEKKLLDLPKLLDICALYGHENEDMTRLLVVNAIKAQWWMHDKFTAVLSHFLSIVQTMYQRCSSSLEVLFATGNLQDQPISRLRADYLEVMDFINDAVVNMDAIVAAYKHAAVFFCCPVEMSYGNEELLTTLARLHDSLLPSLQRGFQIVLASRDDALQETSGDMRSDIFISLKLLSTRIVNLGWKLLYFCYLSDEAFENSCPFPAFMKMLPANVDDPVIRTDILVQTLRDISQEFSNSSEADRRGTFLQNIEKNHKIMSRVELLQNTGWMSLDDEQNQFLSGSLRHPLETNANDTLDEASPGTVVALQADEDSAILESKISQIKDLFPNYGKGFLAACLEVYNHNPEEVIQRILEGTLHKDLQSLDNSLEQIPQRKSASSVSMSGKGKGKLLESTATMSDVVAYQPKGPSDSSSLSSLGRYIRKTATDSPDSGTLDCRDEKNMAKTSALISQLEYEDEYDDSFDDLGLGVGDSGLEETEILGNRLTSEKGKLREPDGTSVPSNSTKWNSRKKPQFYIKDGKNYSYKVEGSVAVANYNEATLVNQAQKERIHGLGRGGNIPLGAVKRLAESSEEIEVEPDNSEGSGRGVGRGNFRGRGRRGGGRSHYRKDQAMRKHFSGIMN